MRQRCLESRPEILHYYNFKEKNRNKMHKEVMPYEWEQKQQRYIQAHLLLQMVELSVRICQKYVYYVKRNKRKYLIDQGIRH